MGREARARKLRRVVGALGTVEAAQLTPKVAEQYQVDLRTLRKASLRRLTGTGSMEQCVFAYCRAKGVDSATFQDATTWCMGVRASHPTWVPGQPLPPGVE